MLSGQSVLFGPDRAGQNMLSGQSVLSGPDRAGQNMLSGQSVLSGTDYTDKTNRASRATRALGCLEREGVAIPAQATRPGQALCCTGCTDRPAGCWQSVLSVPPGAQLDPTSNYVPRYPCYLCYPDRARQMHLHLRAYPCCPCCGPAAWSAHTPAMVLVLSRCPCCQCL